MASSIEIVLKDNVDKLGSIGDVVRVKRGFARNYLIPRGLAVMASRSNLKQVEHEKAVQAQRVEKLRAEQALAVAELEKINVMIAKEASEEGKLFGSVTASDLVEALSAKGVEVDRRKIVMPSSPIKAVGSYEVQVKMLYGVTATIKVEVKTRA